MIPNDPTTLKNMINIFCTTLGGFEMVFEGFENFEFLAILNRPIQQKSKFFYTKLLKNT